MAELWAVAFRMLVSDDVAAEAGQRAQRIGQGRHGAGQIAQIVIDVPQQPGLVLQVRLLVLPLRQLAALLTQKLIDQGRNIEPLSA